MAASSSRLELCTVLRKEFLSCNICQEKTRDLRSPPCSHRFCISCLQAYVISTCPQGNKIQCPTCHNPTILPKEGVRNFPKNKTLLQLDDVISREEKRGIDCSTHHGNEVLSFCVNCWDPLCLRCLTEKTEAKRDKHRGHQLESLAEACQYAVKVYESNKCAFGEKKKKTEGINDRLEAYIKELESEKVKNIETVHIREKELHDLVRKWAEQRSVDIHALYTRKEKEVRERQEKVNKTAKNIDQMVLSVTQIIANLQKGESREILKMNSIARQAHSNAQIEEIEPLAEFEPYTVTLKTDTRDSSVDTFDDLYGSGPPCTLSSIFGQWEVETKPKEPVA